MSNEIVIYYDARMLGFSGIGNHIEETLARLSKIKSIKLNLIGNPETIKNYHHIRAHQILQFDAPIYSIREQILFPFINEKKAILHIPHYNAPIKHLSRSVVVIHDLIHLDSEEFKAIHYKFYARTLLGQIAKKARAIVTVSEYTKKRFLQEFPNTKKEIYVIPNGINHEIFFSPTRKEINSFKEKYSLPDQFFLVVGIGKKHKNLDNLIKSLKNLWLKKEINIPLVIAGTKNQIPKYARKEIIPEIESFIKTIPYLDKNELRNLYASAFCFIMPSKLEGFGFPLLEAMACGVPTISSNATSLPEIGGDATFYFDPYNIEEIQTAILKIVNDSGFRKSLIQRGKEQSKKFSWDKSVKLLIEIYKKIY